MSSTVTKDTSSAPALVKLWLGVYHAISKICIPGTNYDISFTAASAVFLFCCRLVIQRILESFGWPDSPDDRTMEAAACLAGVCHSSTLLPFLAVLLLSQPYRPTARVDTGPQWYQDGVSAALQFCTGYMIYDAVMNILVLRYTPDQGFVFKGSDAVFLGHHVATIVYMSTCRILKAAHISAFACMFWGELTNPLFNSYLVCGIAKELDCCNGPFAQQVMDHIETTCALVFIVVRSFFGPVLTGIHVAGDLLFAKTARENLPLVLRIIFTLMIWGVLLGSIPYIKDFIDIVKKKEIFGVSQEL